jgi:hypothetical protein
VTDIPSIVHAQREMRDLRPRSTEVIMAEVRPSLLPLTSSRNTSDQATSERRNMRIRRPDTDKPPQTHDIEEEALYWSTEPRSFEEFCRDGLEF